jgi:multidrug efflux pump subunit AcrA (membrane-fusion protein)
MEGVKAIAARASVKRYRNIAILAAALILTIVVPWELKVSAPFKILPSEESIVTAETQGVVTDIKVKEGDIVHKGQLLARVSDFERNDLAQNYFGQLQTARELNVMRSGTRPEAIAVQEALLQGKKVELDNVRKTRRRAQLEANVRKKIALNRAQRSSNAAKSRMPWLDSRNDFEKFDNTEKWQSCSCRGGGA